MVRMKHEVQEHVELVIGSLDVKMVERKAPTIPESVRHHPTDKPRTTGTANASPQNPRRASSAAPAPTTLLNSSISPRILKNYTISPNPRRVSPWSENSSRSFSRTAGR